MRNVSNCSELLITNRYAFYTELVILLRMCEFAIARRTTKKMNQNSVVLLKLKWLLKEEETGRTQHSVQYNVLCLSADVLCKAIQCIKTQ